MPKHQNHSATIFYKPSIVDLRILYSVWHSDDLSISPTEWPFPQPPFAKDKNAQPHMSLQFKPIQYIHIEPAQLKTCWPNCVVLMSIAVDPKVIEEALKSNLTSLIDAQFKIMGSNNFIELP
jgi:hypothetical protein